jgi:integrase
MKDQEKKMERTTSDSSLEESYRDCSGNDVKATLRKDDCKSSVEGSEQRQLTRLRGLHVVSAGVENERVWYIYAWRGGPQLYRIVSPNRPSLTDAQRERIEKVILDKQLDTQDPREQTLGWLIDRWRLSPEWEALCTTTKKTWKTALDVIGRKWGRSPLMVFYDPRTIPQIIQWRDSRKATPTAADNGIKVLRALLKFGRFQVGSTTNIAAGIPCLYAGGGRAEIIWLPEEIELFVETALSLGKRGLADAVRLAAVTGLRRADLVTVSEIHLKPAAIFKKALKKSGRNRRHVTIPRVHALEQLLGELQGRPRRQGVVTLLVDDQGRAWHPDRLTREVAIIRDRIGLVHEDEITGKVRKKHLHDLRGTFVTKLIAETDLDDQQIARVMGWAPNEVETIRMVYVDQDAYASAMGARIPKAGLPAIPLAT